VLANASLVTSDRVQFEGNHYVTMRVKYWSTMFMMYMALGRDL